MYLHASDTVNDAKAKAGVGPYVDLYNQRRPHSKLDRMTPDKL